MKSLSSDLVYMRRHAHPKTILDLPLELLLRICDYLTWPSLVNLRLASLHIATHILAKAELARQYYRCKIETFMLEHEMSRGFSTSDLGWPLWQLVSANEMLPCYRCLRWKPGADPELTTSAFSRTKSVGDFDLGMVKAAARICIECGIRTGFYGKGCRVGYWMMCRNCHVRLSKASCGSRRVPKDVNADWKEFKYCHVCISNGGLPDSKLQWQHEYDWHKYEEGMRRGKLYRMSKGRILRAERGIAHPVDPVPSEADGTKNWMPCPLRNKMGLCNCQRPCKAPLHVKWSSSVELKRLAGVRE